MSAAGSAVGPTRMKSLAITGRRSSPKPPAMSRHEPTQIAEPLPGERGETANDANLASRPGYVPTQ